MIVMTAQLNKVAFGKFVLGAVQPINLGKLITNEN
jgi:hypothetical protein